MVLVGRIARPHGLRGQVAINADTDFVEARFRVGETLWVQREGRREQLTIASARFQNGHPVVAFEGLTRIDDVERLAGLELRIPEDALQPLERGQYYQHQLVGCMVETAEGAPVGTVRGVEGGPGSSLLVVQGERSDILIPLAAVICVEIDVGSRRIRIDPPEGLLDLNERRGEVRHRDDFSPHGRGRPRRRHRQPGN
jgi:16S rRNA processing protein RimM